MTTLKKAAFSVLTAIFLSTGSTMSAENVDLRVPQGMKLVWADEFDHDGLLDAAWWGYEEGLVRNHEWQYYTPNNAYCHGGVLVLEAVNDTVPNPRYVGPQAPWPGNVEFAPCTSASVNTRGRYEFLYGRLEVRARISDAAGTWPAIWTLGRGLPWPSCGEIDVMECYPLDGVRGLLANEAHGSDKPHDAVWNSTHYPLSQFIAKDPLWLQRFHVWTMDWTPEKIVLAVDGQVLNTADLSKTINGKDAGEGVNPFHRPQYILLDLAIAGQRGGDPDWTLYPQRYEIDYVRVYQ